jgi:hypothetical protein
VPGAEFGLRAKESEVRRTEPGVRSAESGVRRTESGVRPAGPGVRTVIGSFGRFLALFFVPALPVRYGLGFGVPALSAAAGLIIAVVAVSYGVRDVRVSRPRWVLLAELLAAVGVGTLGGFAALAVSRGYPETRLLAGAAVFLVLVSASCAAFDRIERMLAARPRAG